MVSKLSFIKRKRSGWSASPKEACGHRKVPLKWQWRWKLDEQNAVVNKDYNDAGGGDGYGLIGGREAVTMVLVQWLEEGPKWQWRKVVVVLTVENYPKM